MTDNDKSDASFLPNWQEGKDVNIEEILKRHLPWIQAYVHRKLGAFPRHKSDTGDIVQEAMVQFLKYGPRIHLTNEKQFRALLCRIVENVVCNEYDWFTACRRTIDKERPLPSDTVLNLNMPQDIPDTPSQIVNKNQEEAWLRLGLEFLGLKERQVIVLRNWQDLSFIEIGERLAISKVAARKRYYKAVKVLIDKVEAIKAGKLETVLDPDLL